MLVLEFEVSSTIISKVILEHHKQIIKLGWEHKVIVSNEKLQKFLQSNGIDVISLIDLSKEYNIDENIEMKSFRNYRNLIIPEALYQARNISNFNENKYIKNYLKTEYLIRKIYEKEKPDYAISDQGASILYTVAFNLAKEFHIKYFFYGFTPIQNRIAVYENPYADWMKEKFRHSEHEINEAKIFKEKFIEERTNYVLSKNYTFKKTLLYLLSRFRDSTKSRDFYDYNNFWKIGRAHV